MGLLSAFAQVIAGHETDDQRRARIAATLSTEELCNRAKEARQLASALEADRDAYMAELEKRLTAYASKHGKYDRKGKGVPMVAGARKVRFVKSHCLDQARLAEEQPEIVSEYRKDFEYVLVT